MKQRKKAIAGYIKRQKLREKKKMHAGTKGSREVYMQQYEGMTDDTKHQKEREREKGMPLDTEGKEK